MREFFSWNPIRAIIILIICSYIPDVLHARVLAKYGYVNIFFDTNSPPISGETWGRSWPQGITFASNRNKAAETSKRSYVAGGEELVISCNITTQSSPTSTRLVPPISWIMATGSRVKVLHSSNADIMLSSRDRRRTNPRSASYVPSGTYDDSKIRASIIEISVMKSLVDNSLKTLRMCGFEVEDVYRIIEKGPWVLSFNLAEHIPTLFSHLEVGDMIYSVITELGLNQKQCVHIASHCPYLIAQYSQYRGRDVGATARALLEAGYSSATLVEDVMRFPSMLASPPDRIRGWSSVLSMFGVLTSPTFFGKLLKRAPFMFYLNPPDFDRFGEQEGGPSSWTGRGIVMTSASEYVLEKALGVLRVLQAYELSSYISTNRAPQFVDKIVRTRPYILLESAEEILQRLNFFDELFFVPCDDDEEEKWLCSAKGSLSQNQPEQRDSISQREDFREYFEYKNTGPLNFRDRLSVGVGAGGMGYQINTICCRAKMKAAVATRALLLAYPTILSIPYSQLREIETMFRSLSISKNEFQQLVRKDPSLFKNTADELQVIFDFFRYECAFKKLEIALFLMKYPAILSESVDSLVVKLRYLEDTIGGSVNSLKQCPGYLACDLDSLIRFRTEVLKAIGIDPLYRGLKFLLYSSPDEFAESAGIRLELLVRLKTAFVTNLKKSGKEKKMPVSKDSVKSMLSDSLTDSSDKKAQEKFTFSKTMIADLMLQDNICMYFDGCEL